jgi:CheY-like chemotaxis protein
MLDADRTRLAQILSNLLNNSAKFTGAGGRVDLRIAEDGPDVVIRVSDTGIGIPRHMLAHVFEMFAQVADTRARQHGGLGIGLTLVRRLVELHGGQVWAESEGDGRGSTFVVRLPQAEMPTTDGHPLPDAPIAPTSSTRRRVLVVDDNIDAATMLATLLEMSGHDVQTAFGGAAALELLRDFQPDVAFLDIGMPGMNGFELARRIRAEPRLAGMTLVAVTGWGQDEDRRQSLSAGLDHHLTKPVDAAEVLALVNPPR